mmetsp:Transcript_9959/g.9850  ORF Transcript_9959/g.9850 Transcript_9959/m.9850 type:complete len:207 (-) Transcript_9959:1115-1735(-)
MLIGLHGVYFVLNLRIRHLEVALLPLLLHPLVHILIVQLNPSLEGYVLEHLQDEGIHGHGLLPVLRPLLPQVLLLDLVDLLQRLVLRIHQNRVLQVLLPKHHLHRLKQKLIEVHVAFAVGLQVHPDDDLRDLVEGSHIDDGLLLGLILDVLLFLRLLHFHLQLLFFFFFGSDRAVVFNFLSLELADFIEVGDELRVFVLLHMDELP